MFPNSQCISYLRTHQFIRNFSANHLYDVRKWQDMSVHVWYCVGIIQGERYVHCIRFLKKSPKPGITSYCIEWFNTAPFSHLSRHEMPTHFESVRFWVHSGVALRKNFFLFEDRMSLIRSTFFYDEETKLYYRMSALLHYLEIPDEIPRQIQIYTSSNKCYCFQKRIKKRKFDEESKKKNHFVLSLKKFVENHNHRRYMELHYPKLFEEAQFIISQNGNPS